jgi:uncharacterized protein (TIGR02145 family)
MKKKYLVFPLLIMCVFIAFASSCSKDDDNSNDSQDDSLNEKTTAVFNSNITYGTMTDQDGNIYKTVTIGTQTWMAENLRTTKYNDGTDIPNITLISNWYTLTTGAYCNYDNTTIADTIATYGRLYNWYAVNTGKLAPKGWHVPTDDEWTVLETYLGKDVAGAKMKETGYTHWNSPNTGATNETGFTALPGGFRSSTGIYYNIGTFSIWWSATEEDDDNSLSIYLFYYYSKDTRDASEKNHAYSVRCVKD